MATMTGGHRAPHRRSVAQSAVLNNADLVGVILARAALDPKTFVTAGRVSTTWRDACRNDAALLLSAARRPDFLTKRVFAGLFALSPREADGFPRGKKARRQSSGFMFMYGAPAVNAVLPSIGGIEGWRLRIANRSRTPMRPSSDDPLKGPKRIQEERAS